MTKGTLEGEYHKYEPKPASRFRHTAHLLTVVQTCRRQGRSVIDFFAQALLANSNNYLSRPSLLPKY
ncbi:hypothetical protein [Nostoc sp.]